MQFRRKISIILSSAAFGLIVAMFAASADAQVNATFVSKVWNPTTIAPNGISTLTVSIQNNTAVALTGVTFTDTLPAGLTPAGGLDFGCGGEISSSGPPFVLNGNLNIPASSTCVVVNNYTSANAGVFTNSTANISGWNGDVLAFAPSILTVAFQFAFQSIPTLSQYALILLALGVAFVAWRVRLRANRRERYPRA